MQLKVLIGHLTLTEPVVTRVTYECAAWWSDVEIPAGTYEVFGYCSDSWSAENDHFYGKGVDAEGIVVADWFPALFGGVRIPGPVTTYVGKKNRAGRVPYELMQNVVPCEKLYVYNMGIEGERRVPVFPKSN